MMPAEGHGPADLPREATTTPGRDDALTLVVAGHDDAAKWSVPIGVRTASEWAWRAIVIAAALIGAIKLLGFIEGRIVHVAQDVATQGADRAALGRWMAGHSEQPPHAEAA